MVRYNCGNHGLTWRIEVVGRSGVEFHVANKASELKGCIGPGLSASNYRVNHSEKAMIELRQLLPDIEYLLHITHYTPSYP
jgi:hypothetical protein